MINKTIIIAEAGVNHNGDLKLAKQLIDVASDAGADYVKFQTFKAKNIVSKTAKMADYQKSKSNEIFDSQFNMLEKLELSYEVHHQLIKYCKLKNIKFLTSAFDLEGLEFVFSLNLDLIKIPSGEITNYQYLKKISLYNSNVILSTGLSTIEEINIAINILTSHNLTRDDIIILHCNTQYPTLLEDVNLRAMLDIKKNCNVDIGFSDHTLEFETPISAVTLGAKVIEKHFTLSRDLIGPDHSASLEPEELKNMIKSIRNVEKILSGNGLKIPTKSEIQNKIAVRKSLFTTRKISAGTFIDESMLKALRPGDGISPIEIPNLVGKKIINGLESGTKLNVNDFE